MARIPPTHMLLYKQVILFMYADCPSFRGINVSTFQKILGDDKVWLLFCHTTISGATTNIGTSTSRET